MRIYEIFLQKMILYFTLVYIVYTGLYKIPNMAILGFFSLLTSLYFNITNKKYYYLLILIKKVLLMYTFVHFAICRTLPTLPTLPKIVNLYNLYNLYKNYKPLQTFTLFKVSKVSITLQKNKELKRN